MSKCNAHPNSTATASQIDASVLEHEVTTVARSDGTGKTVEQVRITAKGLAKLAKVYNLGHAA